MRMTTIDKVMWPVPRANFSDEINLNFLSFLVKDNLTEVTMSRGTKIFKNSPISEPKTT